MKIIDLINMKAEGKEMPKKIRVDHWCYNFEWVKHISNYYDENNDIDLMSCLSMDKEELNYEVEIIEEDKKIEKLDDILRVDDLEPPYDCNLEKIWVQTIKNHNKINELIDKVNSLENKQ